MKKVKMKCLKPFCLLSKKLFSLFLVVPDQIAPTIILIQAIEEKFKCSDFSLQGEQMDEIELSSSNPFNKTRKPVIWGNSGL